MTADGTASAAPPSPAPSPAAPATPATARSRATGPGSRRPARKGPRRAALSPSRAKDFLQCPLLFRLRTVDGLTEPGSLATHKGTLVHAILERLYDLPARERTPDAAIAMLPEQWEAHRAKSPEVMGLFEEPAQIDTWLGESRDLISSYFHMENPQRLAPAERELFVETEVADGLLIRGFVDRLDIAPDGAMRVVDYKTGKSPSPRFQEEALFQMRFYGLVLWRLRGQAPARLQLLYLKDGRTLTHDPRPSSKPPRRAWLASGTRSRTAPTPATSPPSAGPCATGAPSRPTAPSSAARLPHCRTTASPASSPPVSAPPAQAPADAASPLGD